MATLREIEVIHVGDDGSGYAILHLTDGTSIGQRFQRAPVTDAADFMAFLTACADETLVRQSPPPAASAAVKSMVGQRIQPTRPPGLREKPAGPP